MNLQTVILTVLLFMGVNCHDSESLEYNGLEESPFYETIILSDIADIINDFDNSNVPFEKALNESDSDDDIEQLLSEYQQHLEKAHTQRVNYLEKAKLKNKVPIIRHEKFTKTNGHGGNYYDRQYSSFYEPQSMFQNYNPFEMFVPFNNNYRYIAKGEQMNLPNDNNEKMFGKLLSKDEDEVSAQPKMKSCYCKESMLPCKCGCKQCFIAIDQLVKESSPVPSDEPRSNIKTNPLMLGNDDTLNIRIKVDVQVPKLQEHGKEMLNNQVHDRFDLEAGPSKDFFPELKTLSSNFNFPIPMNLLGYKKAFKYDKPSSLHKFSVHKKKKSKSNNINKKHRKKMITYHKFNIEPVPSLFPVQYKDISISKINENETHSSFSSLANTEASDPKTTTSAYNATENVQEEKILLLVNISNLDNTTNEIHVTEGNVDAEHMNAAGNATARAATVPPHLMLKRQTTSHTNSLAAPKNIPDDKKESSNKSIIKKSEKSIPSDSELLFWPNANSTRSVPNAKNITTMILENENKKVKLNMSADALRRNHTSALEKAIFGDVGWDDVNAIVPAFISFVGKYIDGILTFCSQTVCHSMKCANKTCLHRICEPRDRYNNKGHCIGSTYSDSVASMESIMDLPSNVAFEIVDILQDRMIGKLFGKSTLCIHFKCITFAANKKYFAKNKCTVKELNNRSHCTSTKDVKVA